MRLRDAAGRSAAAVWLVGALLGAPCALQAQEVELTLGETEDLVRMRHYEGLPEE
ncbi:MAG: hypothetical protein HKP30_00390, partial [Myxococcales bacterium]|nr:hypothetical protein [Myxococcales bacterium]